MEVKLAKAEVKALRYQAKMVALRVAESGGRSESSWVRPGEGSVANKRRRQAAACERRDESAAEYDRYVQIEHDEMLGALEVFGVLTRSLLAFSQAKGLPHPSDWVQIEFSSLAIGWLAECRRGVAADLEERRASVEMAGGARNDTFVLFVLDGIAKQLAEGAEAAA